MWGCLPHGVGKKRDAERHDTSMIHLWYFSVKYPEKYHRVKSLVYSMLEAWRRSRMILWHFAAHIVSICDTINLNWSLGLAWIFYSFQEKCQLFTSYLLSRTGVALMPLMGTDAAQNMNKSIHRMKSSQRKYEKCHLNLLFSIGGVWKKGAPKPFFWHTFTYLGYW